MKNEWYVKFAGKEAGPFTSAELRQLVTRGQIVADSEVRCDRDGAWTRAARVRGLIPSHSAPPRKPPGPPPLPPTSPPAALRPASEMPPYLWGIIGGAIVLIVAVVSFVVFSAFRISGERMAHNDADRHPTRAAREILPAETNDASRPASDASNAKSSDSAAEPSPEPSDAPDAQDAEPQSESTPAEKLPSADGGDERLDLEDMIAQVEPSVALVNGKRSGGTGFVIRPGILATNKHVIDGEYINDLKVHFPSAEPAQHGPYSVELVYKSPDLDLAFLSIETDLPPLGVAEESPFRRGQEVVVIGNPGTVDSVTLENAVSRGVLSTTATIQDQHYHQLSISINPGNSGGPVLDRAGQVIGVATAKDITKEGMAFCIPLSSLRGEVEKLSSVTPQETEQMRSMHRAHVAFRQIDDAGIAYLIGMALCAEAMQSGRTRGNAQAELRAVRAELKAALEERDKALTSETAPQVARVTIDPEISDATRQRFADFWANCLELKSYAESPRGNPVRYNAKFTELAEERRKLTESLRLLLGVDADAE